MNNKIDTFSTVYRCNLIRNTEQSRLTIFPKVYIEIYAYKSDWIHVVHVCYEINVILLCNRFENIIHSLSSARENWVVVGRRVHARVGVCVVIKCN